MPESWEDLWEGEILSIGRNHYRENEGKLERKMGPKSWWEVSTEDFCGEVGRFLFTVKAESPHPRVQAYVKASQELWDKNYAGKRELQFLEDFRDGRIIMEPRISSLQVGDWQSFSRWMCMEGVWSASGSGTGWIPVPTSVVQEEMSALPRQPWKTNETLHFPENFPTVKKKPLLNEGR